MSDRTIKVVAADDHPIVISGLKLILQTTPKITFAGSAPGGAALLQLLRELEAHVLLLDLNLPGTNPFRLVKELIVRCPNLKIIAYTNYDHPKLIKDLLDFGVHGYVLKGATDTELFEAITTVYEGTIYLCEETRERLQREPVEVSFGKGQELQNQEFKDSFTRMVSLTERERDVVILIARGYTNKQIADQLYLSKYTIETHRKNIIKKLKFKSSAELVRFATHHGLV